MTTVLSFRMDDGIVLAADSLARRGKVAEQVCRILRIRDVAVAVAGTIGNTGGYDLREIAINAFGEPTNLQTRLSVFEQQLLEIVAPTTVSIHPDDWKDGITARGGYLADAVIAANMNGVPVLYRRSVVVSPLVYTPGAPVACSISQDVKASGTAGMFLGHTALLQQIPPPELMAEIATVGWRQTMRRLIGIEAAAHPERVGGPVDILRFPARGAPQWLTVKSGCTAKRTKGGH